MCTNLVNHNIRQGKQSLHSLRNGPHLWSFTMPTSKVKCLFRVAIAHKRRNPPANAIRAYATCTDNPHMIHSAAKGHIEATTNTTII